MKLLDIAPALEVVRGVVMEIEDCAYPLVKECVVTADAEEAFKDADYAILLGSMPRKEGMDRKDLLKANVGIFKAQALAIDKVARKTIKIVVVGNPANTNAKVLQHFAPSINPEQFSALTRLDQNRATSLLARKMQVSADTVRNVIIWGNHSNTQYPDASMATCGGTKLSISKDFLEQEFVKTVSMRGSAVIAARKLSSAMSAAKAVCDHVRDWHFGTKPNEFVSMAVVSDGSYNVPKGLMFSFPVSIIDGKWKVVPNIVLNEFSLQKISATTSELQNEERDAFLHVK